MNSGFERVDGVEADGSQLSRRNFLLWTGMMAGGAALAGCTAEQGHDGQDGPVAATESEGNMEDQGLADPAKKRRAAQITSTFENSTTEIRYGYAENIDDGRGITAGRAGFTSGTGDMLHVVERYTGQYPDNPLAEFLPALQAINDKPYDERDTEGLDGLVEVWESLGDDPEFRRVQDEVVDELYFDPAMERAEAAGVHSSLGQAIIWDTVIQHGEGDDPDGLPAIMEEAVQESGTVKDDEAGWLATFLDIRQRHLENAYDEATREGWRESVDRVEALRSLLSDGKLALDPPLRWTVYGDTFELND